MYTRGLASPSRELKFWWPQTRIHCGPWASWVRAIQSSYWKMWFFVCERGLHYVLGRSTEHSGDCLLVHSWDLCMTQPDKYFSDTQRTLVCQPRQMPPMSHHQVPLPAAQKQVLYCLLSPVKYFEKAWYGNRPAGINRLHTAVGEMCHEAGLPGHYNNHSLCSTAAMKLYQNDINEQIIMEMTGHCSLAIWAYKRTTDRQKKQASKCLSEAPWAATDFFGHSFNCYCD